MKRVTLGILIALLVLVFAVSGGAQEKKVWGKRNIWAKELTEHLTRLYGGITQLVERGLSEELGDPDFLEKTKKEIEERFHPELIPEGVENVEQFATAFVGYLIDTHQTLKSEWLADEAFIEELKKVTIENLSSWSRCPYALAPKLFEGWRIQALPPVRVGVEFRSDSDGRVFLRSIDLNGPLANAEMYRLGENGEKKLLGRFREAFRYIDENGKITSDPPRLLAVNDQDVVAQVSAKFEHIYQPEPEQVMAEFLPFLYRILWNLYPGDTVTFIVRGSYFFGDKFLLNIPVGKQEQWLVLPES